MASPDFWRVGNLEICRICGKTCVSTPADPNKMFVGGKEDEYGVVIRQGRVTMGTTVNACPERVRVLLTTRPIQSE